MTLMLKQDEEIVIPSKFTHNGNSIISIFGERIILDDASMTNEWEHPLFKAVIKFLFSPIEGKNQDFSNIERNLDEFLSVSYMRNAAEQTDGMRLNSEEYKNHIDFVWRKLRELTIGDLLVGTKEHIKITPFGNDSSTAIDNAIRLMPGEGKEQRLSDINDWENWETWEKMVGFRIKHSKLTEVANSKREHRVFTDFVENLEDYMEHVTIRHYIEPQNAAKEFGLGSEALQGGALRNIVPTNASNNMLRCLVLHSFKIKL